MARPQQTVLNTFVDQDSLLGDGTPDNPVRVNPAGVASPNVPYVDLTRPPYNVVANDTTLAQMVANAQAIEQAGADFDGTGAWLWLPGKGQNVFVSTDFAATPAKQSCIDWRGFQDITLASFGGRLVQQGDGNGPGGDWHLLITGNGSQRVGFYNLHFEQGIITNSNVGQQNHVLFIMNINSAPTSDFTVESCTFGKCIGDAFRLLADIPGDVVARVRMTNCTMRLNGIVDAASGRVGARSGIALQRGISDATFTNIDISGTQNQGIDCEPTGVGGEVMEDIRFVNVRVARSINVGVPVSLGGGAGGAIVLNRLMVDGLDVEGGQVLFHYTKDSVIRGLHQHSATAFPADINGASVAVRGTNENMTFYALQVERTGTSGAGPCLDIETPSLQGVNVIGATLVQGTASYPILTDGVSHLMLDGISIVYTSAVNPAGLFAIVVNAVLANCINPILNNIRLISPIGKFGAVLGLAVRAPRTMSGVALRNFDYAGQAFVGVIYSIGAGAVFDEEPLIQGFGAGAADAAWRSEDAGGAVINTVFPATAGNRSVAVAGYQSCLQLEGVGVPVMAAPDGSTFRRLDGGAGIPGLYVRENGAWVAK